MTRATGRRLLVVFAVATGFAAAPSPASAGFDVIEDGGFEATECPTSDVQECSNEFWPDDPANPRDLFCLPAVCEGEASSGEGWLRLGGGAPQPGESNFGAISRRDIPVHPFPRTLAFDLMTLGTPTSFAESTFTASFQFGSGGICCLKQITVDEMTPGEYQHFEMPATGAYGGEVLSMHVYCTNTSPDQVGICPIWDVDNVKLISDGPSIQITKAPKETTKATQAVFRYESDAVRSTQFECSLDDGAFSHCLSPRIYSGLKKGGHTFTVQPVGKEYPLPASYEWTVKKKKRK